jgi:hypothetical protein
VTASAPEAVTVWRAVLADVRAGARDDLRRLAAGEVVEPRPAPTVAVGLPAELEDEAFDVLALLSGVEAALVQRKHEVGSALAALRQDGRWHPA